MVAQTVELPNIRKFFIPDPGYYMVEGDLQRAETQIVAWEANDPELKEIFHSGRDVHTENARFIFGDPVNYFRRDRLKRCIYAIQNGGKAPKIAELLEDPYKGRKFYEYWTGRFPSIPKWHQKLETAIQVHRQIENVWGYKYHWLDRIDSNIVGHAVPWITQSTIAITINKALRAVSQIPGVELLMQVHDSLLMQVPENREFSVLSEIKKAMSIQIPYPDPLVIPVTLKYGKKSWGELEDWKEAA
jgi:DNA polymerase I